MVRKELKQEQKKPKSKAKKRLASAKKGSVTGVAKVEKNESKTVETKPPMLPMGDLLSVVRMGICFFDKEGKVAYCNEHFSEITGLQLEKLAGKKLRKNMLWGARGQQDEFQELFAEAKESGKPLLRDCLPVGTGEEEQRYWNLNLLPQYESNVEYSGMYLVIEDVSTIRPRAGVMELMSGFHRAALQHNEMQGLLDNLVDVLKDFSNCSYVKMTIVDKAANQVIRAETGGGPGLWDADQTVSSDLVDSIFGENGSEIPSYRTSTRSIYLENINQMEDSLEGALKDLVVNARNSYGFQSLALIPIKLDNRITGFIQMANKRAGGIPGEVLEAVENTTDHLKIILDRIGLKDDVRKQRENLLRQMHERSAHLEALSERLKQEMSERKKAQEEMRVQRDLATELSGIDNIDAALHFCLDAAIRVAGADSGGIYIVERQTGQLILMCSKGLSDEFVRSVSHYDAASPNAQLIMEMKPIYSRFNDLDLSQGDLFRVEGLKGAGIIPILHDGKAIGCLNLASHVHDEISLNQRSALEAVSEQIGSVITRIQDRKALEDSEERYRTLFARTASPILIADADGNYLDGNDAALAFLECTREELIAMNVRDTLPPYLNEQWFEQYRDSWEKGGTIERDYYVWGKIKVMEMTLTSLQLGGRRIVFGIGNDITERKKAELALRESEEKYHQHFNHVSDVIYSLDLELKVVDMSPSVERLLGYKVDELIGRQFEELNVLAPESVPIAYENLKTILAGGRVESSEYQFIAKDGTRKYGEVSGAPLFHDNKLIGIISVARDVTERKRAQEALRASEEMFKNIVEHSNEIFFVQDNKRNFSYMSPQIETISGYSREELSIKWREFFTDNPVNSESQQYAEEAIRTGERQPAYEYEFYKKDGSTILFEVNETPIKDMDGNFLGFVGVARDITEHNKIEKALIRSESKYRSLVESGGAGIATVDMGGQISFANDALCRMTGYSKEEVLMKQFIDFVHPEDKENTLKLFTEAVDGRGLTGYVQFRLVCKDGKVRWFYTNPTEMVLNDQIVGFTAILQDITVRKNTEEALLESEEKYRSVIENANEGILVVQDGQFKFANDRLIGFSKYTREEARRIAEDSFANLLYPDDKEMVLQNYLKRRSGEPAPTQYELRWVDKDGWLRWADIRVSEFLWEGKPASLCFIMDITDRKRSEQALAESEEKFKDLADLLPQIVFEADATGVFTYVNRRGYEVFGYTPDEVTGKLNVTDAITPEERQALMKNYSAILAGETTTGNEYTAMRKDGSTFNVIAFSNTIIQEGKAIGLRGIFTDISQIKQTENALRESEEKYRSVVENAGEAIYIAQDGKIKFANRRTFEIIHYTREELFSRPFTDILHPEDREMVVQRYTKRLR
ncbi:MAG: PAS domain S-box protein, partial [Dehalococcoidia bacterium]